MLAPPTRPPTDIDKIKNTSNVHKIKCERSRKVVMLNMMINSPNIFISKKQEKNFRSGDKRDRTADLLNAIQALSQLSYIPKKYRY